jgi:hypothetical protein
MFADGRERCVAFVEAMFSIAKAQDGLCSSLRG